MTDPASQPASVPWPPILLALTVAGAWALGVAIPLGWPGVNDLPARIIGRGLGVAGLALAGWSIATLVHARTTVRPDRGASVLVTAGPYRRWRNPIYMADVLILLGLAELTHNIWFAVLAPVFAVAVTWLAILPEERHLEAKFGDDYRVYRDRSRRWI